jgi:hypothetical protein
MSHSNEELELPQDGQYIVHPAQPGHGFEPVKEVASKEMIDLVGIVEKLSTSHLMVQPKSAGICQSASNVLVDYIGVDVQAASSRLLNRTNVLTQITGLHHKREACLGNGSVHSVFVDLEAMWLARLNEKVTE